MTWLTLILPIFAGCFRDDGVLDIDQAENIRPLARFRGRAFNEGDTTLPPKQLLELTRPTIALVYHYLGARQNIRTVTAGVVASSPPFEFQIEMKQAPPISIQNDEEVAVGLFWLFSDRNGNGQFDRGMHPEYALKLREIDSLAQLYYQNNDSLLELSDFRSEGEAVEETTMVGAHGITFVRSQGKLDTVWPAMPGFSNQAMDGPVARRKVLTAQDKWERFFENRKRANSNSYSLLPNPEYSLEMVWRYSRRLFPKAGLEKKFNQGVVDLGRIFLRLEGLASKYQIEAFQKGWLDYPFNGFHEAGADWGAGRSRDHFVFFFPTWKSIEMMRRAERSSSFRISNLHQIEPGYNLMECNDQYDCRRMGENDEIRIFLGKSELYFNAPSVIRPFNVTTQDFDSGASNLASGWDGEGTYSFQPGIDFVFHRIAGQYWLDAAYLGATRVQMIDSLRGVGLGIAQQIQFVTVLKEGKPTIEKLVLDWKGNRYVAVKMGETKEEAGKKKILSHIEARPGNLSPAAFQTLKQGYRWLGADTLKLSEPSSQSIVLTGKGFPMQKLLAVDSATLVSTTSDLELQWKRNPDQAEGEWYLSSGSGLTRIPLIGSAQGINDPSRFKNFQLARDIMGSAKDLFLDFQGKPRFTCAEDSFYLVPGDSGFVRTLPQDRNDRLTIEGNSGFELEVPLDSTSDTTGILLDFCGARNTTVKGALIRVLKKDQDTATWSEWVTSQWLIPKANGSMTWGMLFPTPRVSDTTADSLKPGPMQMRIKIENLLVPEGNTYLALNRYRVFFQ